MNGTNRLDLIVGHGAELLLTTGNGFAKTTTHGARNVLIEEMSNFTFIEKAIKEFQCGMYLEILLLKRVQVFQY